MLDKNLIESYKQQVKSIDFAKVLISLGIEITKSGQFCCPFHNDTHPSAIISSGKNQGYCTVCSSYTHKNFMFDTIDIVKEVKGLNYYQAIEYLLKLDNIDIKYEPVKKYEKKITRESKNNDIQIILDNCKSINKYDLDYLKYNRGLLIYDEENFKGIKKGIRDVLVKNNIAIYSNYYNDTNKLVYHFKYDEENYPYYENLNEEFLIVKKRDNFDNTNIPKSQNVGTTCPKFIFTNEREKDIYICEGIEDALSMVQAGRNAISLNSVGNVGKLIEIFEDTSRLKWYNYIIATDKDKAGEKCKERLIEFFEKNNFKYETFKPLDIMYQSKGIKDVNDLWKFKLGLLKR